SSATVSSVVAIGLRINGIETLIASIARGWLRRWCPPAVKSARQPVKPEVDNGRGVESEQLADQQAANNSDTQWTTQLRSSASSPKSMRNMKSASTAPTPAEGSVERMVMG